MIKIWVFFASIPPRVRAIAAAAVGDADAVEYESRENGINATLKETVRCFCQYIVLPKSTHFCLYLFLLDSLESSPGSPLGGARWCRRRLWWRAMS